MHIDIDDARPRHYPPGVGIDVLDLSYGRGKKQGDEGEKNTEVFGAKQEL